MAPPFRLNLTSADDPRDVILYEEENRISLPLFDLRFNVTRFQDIEHLSGPPAAERTVVRLIIGREPPGVVRERLLLLEPIAEGIGIAEEKQEFGPRGRRINWRIAPTEAIYYIGNAVYLPVLIRFRMAGYGIWRGFVPEDRILKIVLLVDSYWITRRMPQLKPCQDSKDRLGYQPKTQEKPTSLFGAGAAGSQKQSHGA
jgi:hypothetical protein